ncbi:Tyrosine protein-kinase src-1 [Taenia solium]|eukprot:TsM_001165200 transcript=TsM_001165200 gene=TsM_001165200
MKSLRLLEAEIIMQTGANWAFALYDFDANQTGDLTFRAGDLLQTLQPHQISNGNGWIIALNPRTGGKGEVPCNYITWERGYSAALDAFKETDRLGAANLLQSQDYLSNFNYVVRPSREGNAMAISVHTANGPVKNYKVYFSSHDQSCFLFRNQTFKTIEDLIVYYMENDVEPGYRLQAYKPFKESLPLT